MSALIRVVLSHRELQIEPGQKGELVVTVQNLGEIVDQYSIEIDGLRPGWYSIPVSEVSLFPQDQDTVRISLHPPAGSESKAGNYDFNVRVTSREMPTERTSVQATLVIRSIVAFQLGLSPERKSTTKEGVFQVRLANPGNVDLDVDLEATDPEEGCLYRFEPRSVPIHAGQSKQVSLVVMPKKGPPRGQVKRYDFTVKATPRAAPMQAKAVVGQLEHKALLPRWVVPATVIAVLLLLCCVISLTGFAIFGEDIQALIATIFDRPTPTHVDPWPTMMWNATQTAVAVTQTAASQTNAATQTAVAVQGTQMAQSVQGTETALAGENAATQTAVAIQASETAHAAAATQTAEAAATLTAEALPTLPPAIAMTEINAIAAEDGHVRQDGYLNPYPNVGDSNANVALQAFLSFDISEIPTGATVESASLFIGTGDKLSDPYGSLGCLRVYEHAYGILDSDDFFTGSPLGALCRFCSPAEQSSPCNFEPYGINALQAKVSDGASRFQVRLQFNERYTDGDGLADAVRVGEAEPTLSVTYTY